MKTFASDRPYVLVGSDGALLTSQSGSHVLIASVAMATLFALMGDVLAVDPSAFLAPGETDFVPMLSEDVVAVQPSPITPKDSN